MQRSRPHMPEKRGTRVSVPVSESHPLLAWPSGILRFLRGAAAGTESGGCWKVCGVPATIGCHPQSPRGFPLLGMSWIIRSLSLFPPALSQLDPGLKAGTVATAAMRVAAVLPSLSLSHLKKVKQYRHQNKVLKIENVSHIPVNFFLLVHSPFPSPTPFFFLFLFILIF